MGPPAGGSVDKFAPSVDILGHYIQDVLPYLYCCKGVPPRCASYFENRPSHDGSQFNPLNPGD